MKALYLAVGAMAIIGGYFVMNKTRGLRNNNPGNLRHGEDWQGMRDVQTDPAFIQFTSAQWGIRAMGKLLMNYQRLHGLSTVDAIISRWAPPSENNTASYVSSVAGRVGVPPHQPINVTDHLEGLVKAIIWHENGLNPYSDTTIRQGLALI